MDDIQLLNILVKQIFKGVTADEVLEFTYIKIGNQTKVKDVRVGEILLTDKDIETLVSEAKMLKESYLWKLLLKRLQAVAQIKMVREVENEKDLIFPKAMILAIQEIEDVVNKLLTLEQVNATQIRKKG